MSNLAAKVQCVVNVCVRRSVCGYDNYSCRAPNAYLGSNDFLISVGSDLIVGKFS